MTTVAQTPRLSCTALAGLVAALGGFLLGYDNLVISGTLDYLRADFKLDAWGMGFAASVAQLGGLAGALAGGWCADRLGLRRSLFLCALLFTASSIGIFFSSTMTEYSVWRLVCGLSSGAATIVAPMYVAEIAAAHMRGRLITVYQIGLVFGIFVAVLSNAWIHSLGDEQWNIEHGWRWMFFASVVPGTLFFFSVILAVESPRWLMKMGRDTEALSILKRLYGEAPSQGMANEIRQSVRASDGDMRELFTGPFIKPLIIGVALAAFSQISGINVLLVYLPEIFKAAGSTANSAFSHAVIVGLVNIFFSFVALRLVDRAGRRALVLLGTTIQFVALASVAAMYRMGLSGPWLAAVIIACVAGHAIGNGVACWVIIAEIFPTRLRGRAMSFAMTSMWVASYLVLLLFPVMRTTLGDAGTFGVFALAALANHFYARFQTLETKGLTLEQIEAHWRQAHAAVQSGK